MPDDAFLSEADWRNLLREIHDRQVIPIVGPELITVPDAATGAPVSLYRSLAPRISQAGRGIEAGLTGGNWEAAESFLLGVTDLKYSLAPSFCAKLIRASSPKD